MMIMAHPIQHQQRITSRGNQQQPPNPQANHTTNKTKNNNTAGSSHNQQEQDGKRTLIKNQLYLIESLQLENANLRNERDQLQLENEELKFQLQMISSSNILNQPGSTFDNQQLERLVGGSGDIKINGNGAQSQNLTTTKGGALTVQPLNSNQTKLLATPLRQPQTKLLNNTGETANNVAFPIGLSRNTNGNANDCKRPVDAVPLTGNRSLGGKSTSLTAFNVKLSATCTSETPNRNLPLDEEEDDKVMLVVQRYGDNKRVHAAAIIIQRAFRKYQICKRFRTITEQLRHTFQSVNQPPTNTALECQRKIQTQGPDVNSRSNGGAKSAEPLVPFVSGASRAAAWESLSYAASRLAASAKQTQSTKSLALNSKQQQLASINQSKASNQQCQTSGNSTTANKQDPVVTAAINFQQLESIRKRQYRVGLNIFNKNPEKGVSFLIAHSFIDSTSPYFKTTTSYYHSNQLHFIDKQQIGAEQLQAACCLQSNFQSCQLCYEEDNLKRNVAHFLLHRKGLAKEKIGQYLGNLQSQFNQDVIKYYLNELEFYGLQIDMALRKFLSTFRLPGEAQKIEKIVDCFAQRYVQCQLAGNNMNNGMQITQQPNNQVILQANQQQQQINPSLHLTTSPNSYRNNLILLTKDEIFILTFAIIMLNTDLHSPSLKPTSRMSATQFVNNLRGVFNSQTINESDLIEIYERVKSNQITTTPDHVTHVMKVQQSLTVTNFNRKELPNLCVPHRRLVCFCRLFEVFDVNKKEKVGQHQREIFLFNDMLLVTKLARRVRANAAQLYTYRQSIPLQGLYVQLFQSTHYNYGIRLCQRSNDETVIMFNARNELDQSRFVDDLGESIAEMDEMETIKAHNIIETIHFKYIERLRCHAMMHSGSNENIHSVTNNLPVDGNQTITNMNKLNNNCDIINTTNGEDRKQRNALKVAPLGSYGSSRNVKSKFSSMSNLSGVIDGKGDSNSSCDHSDNSNHSLTKSPAASNGLRQNQSFVSHINDRQREVEARRHAEQVDRSQPRRSSTSSVHSLDSGLFLSRDVSPNQSS